MAALLGLPLLLLALLASEDMCSRRLANLKVGLYTMLFLPCAGMAGVSIAQFGGHLLVAGLAFAVLLILFVVGAMAGGDVKLGAAVMLWAGPSLALPTVAVIAWTGGAVAVLGWLADRRAIRRLGLGWRPLRRVRQAFSARRGVPYGVALAAGGIYVLWQQMQFVK